MDVQEQLSRVDRIGTAPNSGRSRLSALENGFHFPDGPAFAGRYHARLSAAADQRVRTDRVVGGHDREFGFWFPAEGEVEVAREDLPSRAVIQFDDVALGMGPDPHGAFRVGRLNGVVRSATSARTGPARSSCWYALSFKPTGHGAETPHRTRSLAGSKPIGPDRSPSTASRGSRAWNAPSSSYGRSVVAHPFTIARRVTLACRALNRCSTSAARKKPASLPWLAASRMLARNDTDLPLIISLGPYYRSYS